MQWRAWDKAANTSVETEEGVELRESRKHPLGKEWCYQLIVSPQNSYVKGLTHIKSQNVTIFL